jgi:trimethylamine-N-oxide reductase cytochrome c-type subunit TorC
MSRSIKSIVGAPFRLLARLFKLITPFGWLESGIPLKGRILMAVLLLAVIAGGGYGAYRFYNYTQKNPKFCVSCHLMQPAFNAWAASVHEEINCHDCHHLAVSEMNELLISFVFKRPEKVPERHGKIIVPWKFCVRCHWQRDEDYPQAHNISDSRIHSKHYFTERIECSECHGYIVHKFAPEERFCLRCHEGTEVHGTGMEELACLNCHTDRTDNLRPDREKCLFCHGGDDTREKLIAEGTVDVRFFQPGEGVIERAVKIDVPKGAPMRFFCYECHKPHEEVRPDWGNCLDCHRNIPDAGRHNLHINVMGMECKQCHRPHVWTVTEKQARRDCTTCHGYKSPRSFLQ